MLDLTSLRLFVLIPYLKCRDDHSILYNIIPGSSWKMLISIIPGMLFAATVSCDEVNNGEGNHTSSIIKTSGMCHLN